MSKKKKRIPLNSANQAKIKAMFGDRTYKGTVSEAVAAAAKKYGISTSTVYRLKKMAEEEEYGDGEEGEPKERLQSDFTLTARLSLSCNTMSVKLRDEMDRNLGTLILMRNGIRYKRPNQKLVSHGCIPWSLLEGLSNIPIS